MKFLSYLNEGKLKTIYHGDNYKTTKINIDRMNKGNNELGIGIYFSDINVAKSYGRNIISINIDTKKFEDAFSPINKITNKQSVIKMLNYISKSESNLKNILDDYGVSSFDELYIEYMQEEEARNFQIEIAQYSNTDIFVKAWNKFIKIHGLYDKQKGWYCVINTNYKINKVVI